MRSSASEGVSSGRGSGRMPCESCGVQFSVFRRKRACSECERLYCTACLRRGGGMCAPCRALSTRPLARHSIAHLKVRDLQCFLQRQNVSTRGCVEKEELVSLCIQHVNSAAYRRRGRGAGGAGAGGGSPFATLKGLTTNLNEFINSAFELRPQPFAAPPPPPRANSSAHSPCYNTAHAHGAPPAPQPPQPPRERFTTRPGGEADISVPVPPPQPAGTASPGAEGARVDTADCFEIEDLDDAGWEFVTTPADPLPNDSEVLLTTTDTCSEEANRIRTTDRQGAVERPRAAERPGAAERPEAANRQGAAERQGAADRLGAAGTRLAAPFGTPQRAASELELREERAAERSPDTTSLQDESLLDDTNAELELAARAEAEAEGDLDNADTISLSGMTSDAELTRLSVRQLKRLLARHRVEFRGCLERAELLDRAMRLYADHAKYKDEVENLPLEECCKICMAAPLQCVLLECGHIAACTRCAKQLAECPICRQYVVRAVRFFRS